MRQDVSKKLGIPVAALVLATLGAPGSGWAQDPSEALGFERTPPRLSFVDGDVSFWRPDADTSFWRPEAEEWSAAEVNTPLAAGDELYAATGANLEVQIGPRAYLRAGEETQIALASLEPDFLQLRVSEGSVSLDLRTLTAGQTFEVDTPSGAFTIERSGYYRIGVTDDTATFVARRGGRASVTVTRGATATIAPSEQVVITGADAPQLETYAAPELDAWDRWNYARTDSQLDAVSARYVPAGVYGVDDLDHHGDWRVVPTYGAIWVPRGLAVGWAPYTTGRWVYDPFYGWTWVDAAPWGWAPYHYGRWVNVSGYWAWAPGPLVVRPYYAPALVAFFGGGGVSVGLSVGPPRIGWVALGWGEPIVPWWGPQGFRGVPRWVGWGGPRVVNRVVIRNTVAVRAREIREYENQHARHAFVAVDRDQFGRRGVAEARLASVDAKRFRRLEGDLDVRPARESLSPSGRAGRHPPRAWQERAVVATRKPRPTAAPELVAERSAGNEARRSEREPGRRGGAPPVRVVEPSPRPSGRTTLERPPFGTRGEGERATPPPPPRYRQGREDEGTDRAASPGAGPAGRERAAAPAPEPRRRESEATQGRTEPRRRESATTQGTATPRQAPATPSGQGRSRDAVTRDQPRDLPGEPANRVYRQREPGPRKGAAPAPATREPSASGAGPTDRGSRLRGGQAGARGGAGGARNGRR